MTPPIPKCPKHNVFMKYHSDDHPHRWLFCPECNDYWRECGTSLGRTEIKPAFEASS